MYNYPKQNQRDKLTKLPFSARSQIIKKHRLIYQKRQTTKKEIDKDLLWFKPNTTAKKDNKVSKYSFKR